MIQRAAKRLAQVLAGRGIIEAEDADVYAYGYELMISTALNIGIVIIVSLVFSAPLAWLFFLLPFIPLRMTAGGYHAKTYLGCSTVFAVAFTLLLIPAVYLAALMTPALLLGVSAVNLLLVLLLSPLPADGKPMNAEEKAANRKRSVVIALIALAVTAVSFIAGGILLRLLQYFALGQAGAALSIIAGKLLYIKKTHAA